MKSSKKSTIVFDSFIRTEYLKNIPGNKKRQMKAKEKLRNKYAKLAKKLKKNNARKKLKSFLDINETKSDFGKSIAAFENVCIREINL